MADLDLYTQVQKQGQDPILKHVGLVKRTALHLKARIPQVMDVDELIQVGMVGLIEASQNFDASRGVEFEIFARTRIRGAILDEVRRISVLPRSAISHIRETNEATQELATASVEPQRKPSWQTSWERMFRTTKKNALTLTKC